MNQGAVGAEEDKTNGSLSNSSTPMKNSVASTGAAVVQMEPS